MRIVYGLPSIQYFLQDLRKFQGILSNGTDTEISYRKKHTTTPQYIIESISLARGSTVSVLNLVLKIGSVKIGIQAQKITRSSF